MRVHLETLHRMNFNGGEFSFVQVFTNYLDLRTLLLIAHCFFYTGNPKPEI